MATVDLKTLLRQRIQLADPTIDTSDTSQWSELVARPMDAFLSTLDAMLARDEIVRDIRRSADMTQSEIEALASNFYVPTKPGSVSVGAVTLFFASPQDVVIPLGQNFIASNGSKFVTTTTTSITRTQLSTQFDPVKNAYRLDILGIQSKGTGPSFSIKSGDIVAMDGQPANVIQVANESDFSESVAAETRSQYAARIIQSASMRNLCSADSAKALVNDDPRVVAATAVGAGDVEMIRDIVFGVHANGKQDTYVFSASPLVPYVVDQQLTVGSLPSFLFFGRNLSEQTPTQGTDISEDLAGPIVFIQSVDYGTGTSGGFAQIGTLTAGEDFLYEFLSGYGPETKNSSEEFWRIKIVKRPADPANVIRVTALRAPVVSALQKEFRVSGARTPAHETLFKAFTTILVDVTAVVKPLPGASTLPETYQDAIRNLIVSNPIAASIDDSDIVATLVAAGADRVLLPIKADARILYPDLNEGRAVFDGAITASGLERIQATATARTMAFYPGTITVRIE